MDTTMDSAHEWDNYYKHIRRQNPLRWPDVQAVRLLSQASLTPNSKILEIACGEGRNTRLLIENGYDVTVIEQNKVALDIVQDLYKLPSKKIICAEVSNGLARLLPSSFDLVFCWGLIHFVKDPVLLLRSLATLLEEGNKLIISFTAETDNCDRVGAIQCFYDEQLVRTTLQKGGFNIEQIGLQSSLNLQTSKQEAFYWVLANKR